MRRLTNKVSRRWKCRSSNQPPMLATLCWTHRSPMKFPWCGFSRHRKPLPTEKGRGSIAPPRPTPDQQKIRYLNLAGVPLIEHPCSKMESGNLRPYSAQPNGPRRAAAPAGAGLAGGLLGRARLLKRIGPSGCDTETGSVWQRR